MAGLLTAGSMAAAAVVGLVSCGGEDGSPSSDRQAAIAAAEAAQRAFVEEDVEGLCDLMSTAGRKQAGEAAHGRSRGCTRDLPAFFTLIEEGGGWRHRGEPETTGAELSPDGERATVRMALGRWEADVPLARERGEWKLDSFFGARPGNEARLARAVLAQPRPAGATVQARESRAGRDSRPCSDVEVVASSTRANGGCFILAVHDRIEISVLTAFGDFRFGTCGLVYNIAIEPDGRTVVENVDFGFADAGGGTSLGSDGCGAIDPCEGEKTSGVGFDVDELVWKGRIAPLGDRRFRHRFNACLDTGVGFYHGTVETRLVRRGGRWRAVADRAPVGVSGFRFHGSSKPTGAGVELRAAGA